MRAVVRAGVLWLRGGYDSMACQGPLGTPAPQGRHSAPASGPPPSTTNSPPTTHTHTTHSHHHTPTPLPSPSRCRHVDVVLRGKLDEHLRLWVW